MSERIDPRDPDFVDGILAQWREERPDLDLDEAMMGAVMRMSLLAQTVFAPAGEHALEAHGIKQPEFDVLATLRRHGPPYALTPSQLSDELMMSRAGMTKRIDRLESLALIERRSSREDRRSFDVALTAKGREVIDAALTDTAGAIGGLMAGLRPGERAIVDEAMRLLVRTFRTR